MQIVLIYIPVVGSSLNWGAIKGQGFCTQGIIVIISRDVKGAKYTKQNKLKSTCVLKENVSSSGHVPVPLHLRADIFLLVLSLLFICGKEYLPKYTREHCKNVVTLTNYWETGFHCVHERVFVL